MGARPVDIDGAPLEMGDKVWFAYEEGSPLTFIGIDGEGFAVCEDANGAFCHIWGRNLTHDRAGVPRSSHVYTGEPAPFS